ncbi:transcriptional regulator [Enterococcus plantarum]|uniref:Transcriptional regulator n=1 Tax=Enterococcus plantarum TaxID=1077675 RepID=A0A2W4B2C8_9ENTE|nr:transcriptional regulator [Enterococcus plantarum]MBO0467856.1 transcriptional regulator [Enterococcus plantarum]PZL69945.1 transcriptional regulator [Enterococcus plantarum]
MRKSTFNYVKDILADYPRIEEYIKQREEELRYPYRENDLNSGIKGNRANYNIQDNLMITIEQDQRLAALERNQRVVSNILEECCEDTKIIIQELYMRRMPKYTIQGLITNSLIFVGRTKAFELRDWFFLQVAKDLNLTI